MLRLGWIFVAWACSAAAQVPNFVGTWQGTLEAGPIQMRLGLKIRRTPPSGYKTSLDSIDQAVSDIEVDTTLVAGREIHLDMPAIAATYEGELSEDGSTIQGVFTQGADIPLEFHRVARLDTLRRPQNPGRVSYRVQPVTIRNGKITLTGTLTLPPKPGLSPAAILVSGAGRQDRDGTVAGHKPFLVLADYLTQHGIAVLRLDDRGTGGSTGRTEDATIQDSADDMAAAIAFLRRHPNTDRNRIGLISFAEGAHVAALVAARPEHPAAFLVMFSAAGLPGDQVLYQQGEEIARASGATEAAIADARQLQERMVAILREEPDEFVAIEKIRDAWAEGRELLPAMLRSQVDAQIMAAATPELRSHLLYDPATVLKSLRLPVLAVNGSRDVQVSAAQNVPALRAALDQNPDAKVVELQGRNHLLQTCQTCLVTEYAALEETISPEALETVANWILAHTRR